MRISLAAVVLMGGCVEVEDVPDPAETLTTLTTEPGPDPPYVTTLARIEAGSGGMELDLDGNVLMGDFGASLDGPPGTQVYRMTPAGEVDVYADGLIGASGNALLPDGSLLLSCPNGLAIPSDGNIYVANFGTHRLVRVDRAGKVSEFVSLTGNNLGHVTFANERLYVVLRTSNQLASVTLDGEVTIIAGTGDRGRRDGRALGATLSLPNDIAVSADGTILYLNDVVPTAESRVISPVLVRALVLE